MSTVKFTYKEPVYKEFLVITYKELIFIPQEGDFATLLYIYEELRL